MTAKLHIVLTGASGFIGKVFIRLARERGHQITALVREATQAPFDCGILVHTLGSGAQLGFPRPVDAVVHLAQSRAYRAFPGDADEMFRVNVAGTHEVLMAAAAAQVSRFCLVSSGAVYEPFLGALDENVFLSPQGNLGATKLAAEVLARPFRGLFAVSTMRLFMPYGPGQTGRLIPDLIRRVRDGEAVTLPAQGGGMRFAPCYVDDVAEALLASVEESWTDTYNVAGLEALTIEQAAQVIGKAMEKPVLIARNAAQTEPAPVVVPELSKFSARYNLGRFRKFTDGITATINAEK